jgi:hypothetical protein
VKVPQYMTNKRTNLTAGLILVLLFGAVGAILHFAGHAQSPVSSQEAENGSLSSAVSLISDSTASGGKAVKFGSGSSGGGGSTSRQLFGFNIPYSTSNAFSQPAAAETNDQFVNRLVGTYGNFPISKIFYKGGSAVPATTWDPTEEGLGPQKTIFLIMGWTLGTWANGSHDAGFITWMRSIPAGYRVMVAYNEANYHDPATNPTAFVADENHIYDLVHNTSGVVADVESWYCFGEFALESGGNWTDAWINPAKADGIGWDMYQNKAGTDDTGATKTAKVVAMNTHLGIKHWGVPEFGDRRPDGSSGAWDNDTDRAAAITKQMNTFKAQPGFEFLMYFNVVGTTGDHRMLTPPYGSDPATVAAYKSFVTASIQ